jgi:hypothetical protein
MDFTTWNVNMLAFNVSIKGFSWYRFWLLKAVRVYVYIRIVYCNIGLCLKARVVLGVVWIPIWKFNDRQCWICLARLLFSVACSVALRWFAFPGFSPSRRKTWSSVGAHGPFRLPLDGFSWNMIFEDCSKICRECPSLIKIWQEWRTLYVKTYVHLL